MRKVTLTRDHLAARVANAVFIPLLHIVFCYCLIYCIDTLEQKECLLYLVLQLQPKVRLSANMAVFGTEI